MDKQELKKLLEEKEAELEVERHKLDGLFAEKVSLNKPLTTNDILQQNDTCADISLEVTELKKLLEEFED